jgi:ABC-2 type transport system ATP-binding protein
MANNEPAVVVKDLYKTFRLPHEQSNGVKQMIVNIAKHKRGYETHRVLNGVSFEIKKGEFFGIVGRNGSGKSTLLKLLAGIYTPDKGLVQVNGSLTPFIELGVGFNPELTGRENVYMNGALLGFSNAEMDAMYDDIVEFAELEKFMDQKLKNYSSGMQVRLAFSIAIRARSDVLILDEVLAVGDQAFQQKCYTYFDSLKERGQTVVLVTHDMSAVKQFCDKALLIQEGRITQIGKPYEISLEYEKLNFSESTADHVYGDGYKNDISVLNSSEKKTKNFKFGDSIILEVNIPRDQGVHIAGFVLQKNGEEVFATNTIGQDVDFTKGKLRLKLLPRIGDGRYKVMGGLFGKSRHDVIKFIEGPEITIHGQPKTGPADEEWHGITHIDNEWYS